MIFIKHEKAIQRIREYERQLHISLDHVASINSDFLLFGGAVRDALRDEPYCKDFDLIFLRNPGHIFEDLSISQHGAYYNSEYVQGLKYRYRNIPVVDVMWLRDSDKTESTIRQLLSIIDCVDLSSSGVAHHPYSGIIEVVPEATELIYKKEFRVHSLQGIFDGDTPKRMKKLVDKGWNRVR